MSVLGLSIQCVGILMVMSLSLFMTRSIKRSSLTYWTVAWVSLSISLLSLSGAFQFHPIETCFYFIYYLGEYTFGFLFYLGCRNYSTGRGHERRDYYILAGFVLYALGIAFIPLHPSLRFIPHFATLAILFYLTFKSLTPARQKRRPGVGLRVMSVALFLLMVNFSLYVPTFTFVGLRILPIFGAYLGYSSIYDLILETLLGFGTIMLVMEDMRMEVEDVNRELIVTKEKLEAMARIDPLTEALNRHAYYTLINSQQPESLANLSGCAMIIDIDNLKPINDCYGHTAGDQAIREVARRLRTIIRADDLLFRWGGDEFLLLLFGADENTVRERIDGLSLEQTPLTLSLRSIPIIFSFGIAEFSNLRLLQNAIERADSAMYASKQFRKSSTTDNLRI
jgi:diguanylate cyclase (GGDEF)-like protein